MTTNLYGFFIFCANFGTGLFKGIRSNYQKNKDFAQGEEMQISSL